VLRCKRWARQDKIQSHLVFNGGHFHFRNLTCLPLFENGGTDARHVRNHGIPAFGVNGFINSPKLAHQDNEYINEQTFLEGITHYETFIQGVSTVSGDLHP